MQVRELGCDGLTGFRAAIEAVWPDAVVQTCIVHLTRASAIAVPYPRRPHAPRWVATWPVTTEPPRP